MWSMSHVHDLTGIQTPDVWNLIKIFHVHKMVYFNELLETEVILSVLILYELQIFIQILEHLKKKARINLCSLEY